MALGAGVVGPGVGEGVIGVWVGGMGVRVGVEVGRWFQSRTVIMDRPMQ